MVDKFRCQSCGSCCKMFNEEFEVEKSFPSFKDKITIELNKMTLPIYPWEVDIFKENGIEVVPAHILFDIKEDVTIVLQYTLKENSCRLLKDGNICSVYEKRPLVCKVFPSTVTIDMVGKQIDLDPQGLLCPSELRKNELMSLLGIDGESGAVRMGDAIDKLSQRYEESFGFCLTKNGLDQNLIMVMANLEKAGVVKAAKEGYNLTFLERRIKKAPICDVHIFFENATGKNIVEYIEEAHTKSMKIVNENFN